MTATSRKRRRLERQIARQAAAANQPELAATDEATPTETQTQQTGKSLKKRARKLLDASPEEMDDAEMELINEMFETAREAVALYRSEVRERRQAAQNGQPVTTRWQIAPAAANSIMTRAFHLIEIRMARRRALKEASKTAAA